MILMNQFASKAALAAFVAASVTLSLSALTPSSDASYFQTAKSLYSSKCAVCHGNDGSANTAKGKELNVRSFRTEEFKKMPDAKVLEIMMKGKGKMEGYEKTLGKDKLTELLAYCRELSNK